MTRPFKVRIQSVVRAVDLEDILHMAEAFAKVTSRSVLLALSMCWGGNEMSQLAKLASTKNSRLP